MKPSEKITEIAKRIAFESYPNSYEQQWRRFIPEAIMEYLDEEDEK